MVKEGTIWVLVLLCLSVAVYFIFKPAAVVFVVLVLIVGWFFRDPEIKVEYKGGLVYSPADGRIMEVEDMGDRKTVKIFMNIFNCHIQRAPVEGYVKSINYKSGKFMPASKDDAAEKNEQNLIVLQNEKGDIGIKQIAGIMARRIVCWVKEGQNLKTGVRLGMIKLGSQVDIILPDNVDIVVQKGEKVKSGLTVVGKWR